MKRKTHHPDHVLKTLTTLGKVKLWGVLVVGLIGLILSSVMTAKWNRSQSDYKGILDNWKLAPISEIRFSPSPCSHLGPEWDSQTHGYRSVSWEEEYVCEDDEGYDDICTTKETHTLRYWKGHHLCMKRMPEEYSAENRIRAPNGEACPSGYKKCHTDSCYRTTVAECPITEFQVLPVGVSPPSPDWKESGPVFQFTYNSITTDFQVWVVRDASGSFNLGRPLMEITMSSVHPCVSSSPFKGTDLSSWSGPSCSGRKDDRYFQMDSMREDQLILTNNLPPHGQWDVSQRPDWIWGMFGRSEVLWTHDCPRAMDDALSVEAQVNAMTGLIVTLLVVTIIIFIIDAYLTWRVYRDLSDDDPTNDEDNMKWKMKVSLISGFIVLVLTIALIGVAAADTAFWDDVHSAECSDPISNDSFDFLAKEIRAQTGLAIPKAVLKGLMWLWGLWTFYWAWKTGHYVKGMGVEVQKLREEGSAGGAEMQKKGPGSGEDFNPGDVGVSLEEHDPSTANRMGGAGEAPLEGQAVQQQHSPMMAQPQQQQPMGMGMGMGTGMPMMNQTQPMMGQPQQQQFGYPQQQPQQFGAQQQFGYPQQQQQQQQFGGQQQW